MIDIETIVMQVKEEQTNNGIDEGKELEEILIKIRMYIGMGARFYMDEHGCQVCIDEEFISYITPQQVDEIDAICNRKDIAVLLNEIS